MAQAEVAARAFVQLLARELSVATTASPVSRVESLPVSTPVRLGSSTQPVPNNDDRVRQAMTLDSRGLKLSFRLVLPNVEIVNEMHHLLMACLTRSSLLGTGWVLDPSLTGVLTGSFLNK